VIVNDLHPFRARILPPKTHSPLLVDSDAVLSFTVAFEFFEAVARWHPKVFDRFSRVEYQQFLERSPLRGIVILPRSRPLEDPLGFLVGE
jgi:hypothetical protein